MSDTVNEVMDTSLTDAEVASAAVRDPELRKLPAGSEEYQVALAELAKGKKATEATAGAKGDDQASTDEQPKKKGLERRFSELTSERDAAKARAAELEARLAALEAKTETRTEPDTEPTIQPDEFDKPKPSADKFETYADYVEALADWKLEKRDFDAAQKVRVAEVQQKQAEVVSSWDAREEATKERVEGYDQLVDADFMQSFTSGTASREAMTYLLESEAGPDLLYELAEDDAKLAGFKSMSPVKQVAYLARLEAKFDKTEPVTTSKAPPPSKALPKGKTVVQTKPIDPRNGPLSFSDYQAWRKAQK